MHIKCYPENLKRRDHFRDPSIYGRMMIFKQILENTA
jgi:hypothetical protein